MPDDIERELELANDEVTALEDEVYDLQRELQQAEWRIDELEAELNKYGGDLYNALLDFYRAYKRGEDITNARQSVEFALTGKNIML